MKKSEGETRKEVNVGTCPRCGSKIEGEASACKSCIENPGSVTTSLEEKPVVPARAQPAVETEGPEALPPGETPVAPADPAVDPTPEKPMAALPEPAAPPLAEEMIAPRPEETTDSPEEAI